MNATHRDPDTTCIVVNQVDQVDVLRSIVRLFLCTLNARI